MKISLGIIVLFLFAMGCNTQKSSEESSQGSVITKNYPDSNLPAPYSTAKNFSKVTGWKDSESPVAPVGFHVEKFADGFSHPRWIYVLMAELK
jgi:hypothetical protein